MQSFVYNNAWIVTEIIDTPRKRYLNVFLAVGDSIDDVTTLIPELVRFARAHGCLWIQALGRVGWGAVLPRYGWRPMAHRFYMLPLDETDG